MQFTRKKEGKTWELKLTTMAGKEQSTSKKVHQFQNTNTRNNTTSN